MKTSEEILEYVQQRFKKTIFLMAQNPKEPSKNSMSEHTRNQINRIRKGQMMAFEEIERFIKGEKE